MDNLSRALAMGASGVIDKPFSDDVFSTYLYTGNGSTQTITNNINLQDYGGMVWLKGRNAASNHGIWDYTRNDGKPLVTNVNSPAGSVTAGVGSASTTGFGVGGDATWNTNGTLYSSWTFRKARNFFDIVTYTGNATGRTIPHNLGSVPGMIIIKQTDATSNWIVYHRSLANTECIFFNSPVAKTTGSTVWNNTTPTDTVFSVGTNTEVNASGGNYVAYIFAHDTSADGIIQCGLYTLDGAGNATVDIGWEPQYVITKITTTTDAWWIRDTTRGFAQGSSNNFQVNDSVAETASTDEYALNGPVRGFFNSPGGALAGQTSIYIAIRRPNKPATSATQVFNPTVYTGNNVDNRGHNTGIYTDMVWLRQRNSTTVSGMVVGDRMIGNNHLLTGSSNAAVADDDTFMPVVSGYGNAFSQNVGIGIGNDATSLVNVDTNANNHVSLAFKRATGFFDVVRYTGNGAIRTIPHQLGVIPELIFVKGVGIATSWWCYAGPIGAGFTLALNSTAAQASSTLWNSTTPTNSVFSLDSNAVVNNSGSTYIAHMFASIQGISKVGTYVGTGSAQTIDCGFTTGARFVLIKKTNNTGDWTVFDTARGIATTADPYTTVNSTVAEATANVIGADVTGFTLTTSTSNVLNDTYLFLAIA